MRFRGPLAAVIIVAACSGGGSDDVSDTSRVVIEVPDELTTPTQDQGVPGPTMYPGTQEQITDARRACRAHDPDGFVDFWPTTVGELRPVTIGTTVAGGGPFVEAFKGLPAGAHAAWCWHRTDDGRYELFVVGPDREFVRTVGTQDHKPRRGPPRLVE